MRDEELPLTTGENWPGHSSIIHADNRLLVFNDLGELNEKGQSAVKAIAGGMTWADIEKKYTITAYHRKAVMDALPKNASTILDEADDTDDGLPFK